MLGDWFQREEWVGIKIVKYRHKRVRFSRPETAHPKYQSKMKLWDLPDDVLSYIIDYLDPLDRMSLIKASTPIRIKQLIQQKR